MKQLKIGVIGLGGRARHVAMYTRNSGKSLGIAEVSVTAVCDVKPKEELIAYAKADGYDPDISESRFYTDVDEMLNKEELDAVIIGTRCNLHTPLAIKVLERNIDLFLEKPVATTMEDLLALKAAGERSKSRVVVSFPLRVTPPVTLSKEIIDSGEIGDVVFANGWTRVAYGGCYYHNWYRDDSITGGLFLQKATHDFDYINYLIGKKPVDICAMKSKMVMKGNKPAGLYCKDCPENPTCPEGTVHGWRTFGYAQDDGKCCYAVDTGNEDSGSAILRYEDGTHLSYSQAFFLRNIASCGRGVFLGGTKGSLTFDFNTNVIKVARSYENVVKDITFTASGAHFGGDERLTENFVKMLCDVEPSHSPLEEGLISALICLKAKQSAETEAFKKIVYEK